MRIHIPKEEEIPVLPECTVKACVERVVVGTSQTGNPKVTVRFIITEDVPNHPEPLVGVPILENFSLQPQAVWRLQAFYRDATGETIPEGDYTQEELADILRKALEGTEWRLHVAPEDTPQGVQRTRIVSRAKI